MEGVGNSGDIFTSKVTQHAVFHKANLAGVDKQHFAFAVRFAVAAGFVFGQEPDTGRDLGVGKELAR